MATNLAGKTYEVQTESDGKWTFHTLHNMKSKAVEQAQSLLETHKFSGVKVIAESERSGEEVIFEEQTEVTDKGLTVVPIEESPVCENLSDFYNLEARRTAGRLLRHYLDDVGMTAIELAFDFGRLKMLERDDKLYVAALSRLAGIQVRKSGEPPADRHEKLEAIFNELKDRAQALMGRDDLIETVRAGGLDALVSKVTAEAPENERHPTILAGLAAAMSEEGDWDGKIRTVIGFLNDESGEMAQSYADEALAEIFDGPTAVTELLGGVADAAQAQRMLVQLCQGRLSEVKNALSCINELNKVFAVHDLKNAQNALLGLVAKGIGGIKPLTREGPEGERTALVNLIRSLEGFSGLMGGPCMAEALTLRAKMALGGPDGDLTGEEAMSKIMAFLPSLPSRAGYVLELSATSTGEKQQTALIRALAQAMRGLNSIEALTGGGQDERMAKQVVAGLNEKITTSGLPDELKKTAKATLAKAMNGVSASSATEGKSIPSGEQRWDKASSDTKVETGPEPPVTSTPELQAPKASASAPAANKPSSGKGPEHRKLVKGQILFEEGDAGTEAFVVSSGAIAIYRRGSIETVLATLGPGELLGELSLIDDQPRAASARAAEDTDLIVLSKESLKNRLQRLEQTDKVLRRLVDVLVNRLRGTARSAE